MTDSPSRDRTKRARRIFATVALVLVPVFLAGCGGLPGGKAGDSSSTDDTDTTKTTFANNSTMATIRDRGRLIVGIRWDAPPFAYQDASTGAPSGIDVSLVNSIAKTIFDTENIEGKITWVPLDPRNNELALSQNKVDIVVGRYAITVAKKNFADFAGPYFADPQQILVSNLDASGRNANLAPGDLNGRKICVVTGSSDVAGIKAVAPAVDATDVRNSVSQCGADLSAGAVSAIVVSHTDGALYLQTTSQVVATTGSFDPTVYGIGVKKGVQDLRAFLNDQIQAFDLDQAYEQWVSGDGSAPARPAVDRY